MLIDQQCMQALFQEAADSPRRRAFFNLHQSHAEPVQRVLIAILPDSYVVPHQHPHQGQFELFLVLQGVLDFLCFAEDGMLLSRQRLGPGLNQVGIELAPGQWHSIVAVDAGAVFMEIKAGPFDASAKRFFAPFAPAEQSPEAKHYLHWMQQAKVASRFTDKNDVLELTT